jgi:hypothetical protein
MQTCARVLLGDRCTLLHTAAKQSTATATVTTAAAATITSSAAATVSSTQARHFVAEVDEPASGIALCRTYVIQNNDNGNSTTDSSTDASYYGVTEHQQQQQQQSDIALWYSVLQQAVEKGIESVNNNVNSNNNYTRGSQVSYSTTHIYIYIYMIDIYAAKNAIIDCVWCSYTPAEFQ